MPRLRCKPKPILHIADVLRWADAHYERTGEFPDIKSGELFDAPNEKWVDIDQALRKGLRGFRPGSSLARLLAKHRNKRNRKQLPKYTIRKILGWVDGYNEESGSWPTWDSGPIDEAPGETWQAVDQALRKGRRGCRSTGVGCVASSPRDERGRFSICPSTSVTGRASRTSRSCGCGVES